MIKQELVELGSRHLVSAIALGTKAVLEIKLYAFGSTRGCDLAAKLRHKRRVEFFAHAKPVERSYAKRQERFADMKSRKLLPFEDHNAPAGLCEQRRRRAASRAAADDRDVVDVDLVHPANKLWKSRFFSSHRSTQKKHRSGTEIQGSEICANLCPSVAKLVFICC